MTAYIGKYGTYYASPGAFPADQRQEYMRANALYICRALSAAGWTLPAIAGLLGNMQRESGINPGRWQSLNHTDKGYGLVQWTPGSKYLDWGRNNGYTEPSMDGQIARLLWELQTTQTPEKDVQYFKKPEYPLTFTQFTQYSEGMVAWNGQTVSAAYYLGRAFGFNYERSAAILKGGTDAETTLNIRGKYAEAWYETLKDKEVSTVITKPLYGYWIDIGTIDTLPKDRTGILLFNRSSKDAGKMGHVGAYDGTKDTELQIGGYGKIVVLSDGTQKSVACEQKFKPAHWSHWAQFDATQTEWDTFLAFIRASVKRGDLYLPRGHGNTAVFDGVKRVVYDCAGLIVKAAEEIGYDFWQGCTTMWDRGFMENAYDTDDVDGVDDDDDTDTPTIRKGDTGEAVKKLQVILTGLGYDLGWYGPDHNGVDGKFGELTDAAVRIVQDRLDLMIDGIVGPKTWYALLDEPAEEQVYTWVIMATEARIAKLIDENQDLTVAKQS